MSSKLEVQWSPIPNKFITWGSEICLYEVHNKEYSPQCIKLSNNTTATLLATNTNHHYIKCLDIYPKSETDLLLAVGLSNGRISLSTFGPTEYDGLGLTGRELVPRHARQCNAVSWNTIETNLVATGLDKYRADNSVLVWDITRPAQNSDNNNSGRLAVNTMAPAVELAKPISEFGVSETANSLAWFNTNSRLLAVGMNMKNIKLVDTRDPNKIINSTLTKAVFGICMDSGDDRHLASYYENHICVWDTRNFEKPILTLPHPKSVVKIAWCPTKINLLSSLQKDSSVISLYDIQHSIIGNEEIEPVVLERVVVPGSPHNIMSFSWHGSLENRFLTIALSGTITDYTVFDRITLNWAPTSNVVWTFGPKIMKYIDDQALQDISTKIKQRAIAGYGLKEEFWKNGQMVDNEMLSNVWNWLYLSSKLVEDGLLRGSAWRHPGVQSVLKIDPSNNKSEMITINWSDLGNNNCSTSARIFKHDDRDKALHLCSWHFVRDSNQLNKFLEQLEKEQAYTRAAAIAVFNLRLRLAIEILTRSPINNLNVVAMALSGFSDDKNSVWKQFCSSTKYKLNDPYLRVIFNFLTAENYNYDNILNENGIAVDDRVAFACMFLPDTKLHEYLKKLSDKLIEEGNLDGLLLTGNNQDGIKLLQRYLDSTGDIQSTALIVVRAFPSELFSETVKDWVASYRNLLDTWQLWNVRAQFDIMLSNYRPSDKAPQQVYVSCNFCGKSISAYMHGLGRGRGPYSRMATANNFKMSSCPNCRKPLPRCAICLIHMGTTTGNLNGTGDGDNNKVIEFANWFTWCQSCRHGGHASHMTHWFEEHSDCPVTACTCKCFSVDAVSNAVI